MLRHPAVELPVLIDFSVYLPNLLLGVQLAGGPLFFLAWRLPR